MASMIPSEAWGVSLKLSLHRSYWKHSNTSGLGWERVSTNESLWIIKNHPWGIMELVIFDD